jgi:hypothetical protein
MMQILDLLAALQDKGWTDAAVADALDVAPSTVYKWKKGIHAPKYERPVRTELERLLKQRSIPKQRRPFKRRRYTGTRTPEPSSD